MGLTEEVHLRMLGLGVDLWVLGNSRAEIGLRLAGCHPRS